MISSKENRTIVLGRDGHQKSYNFGAMKSSRVLHHFWRSFLRIIPTTLKAQIKRRLKKLQKGSPAPSLAESEVILTGESHSVLLFCLTAGDLNRALSILSSCEVTRLVVLHFQKDEEEIRRIKRACSFPVETSLFPSGVPEEFIDLQDLPSIWLEQIQSFECSVGMYPSKQEIRYRYLPGKLYPNVKPGFNFLEIFHHLQISQIINFTPKSASLFDVPVMLNDLKGIHSGQPGWVFANGPSVTDFNIEAIQDGITFAANGGYRLFHDLENGPTYFCLVDSLQIEKYAQEWVQNLSERTVSLLPAEYLPLLKLPNQVPLCTYPPKFPDNRTNYLGPEKRGVGVKKTYSIETQERVNLGHSVLPVMIQIAHWMGCNPIYVIGADHHYPEIEINENGTWTTGSGKTHFTEDYVRDLNGQKREFNPPQLREMGTYMKILDSELREKGVDVFNLSTKSKLKAFRRMPADQALNVQHEASKSAQRVVGRNDKEVINPPKSVTIAVSTMDITGNLSRSCLESIRHNTEGIDYEIIVLDNHAMPKFHHANDMNRALASAAGDYVVFLDEDVIVTNGWLAALLNGVSQEDGVVTLSHWDGRKTWPRRTSHAGAVIDRFGKVQNIVKPHHDEKFVPFVSSACMLVTSKRLRFEESYNKYFHDTDYCLQVWESGKRVKVLREHVFHYRQGALLAAGHDSKTIDELKSADLQTYLRLWGKSGRLEKLKTVLDKEKKLPINSWEFRR